MSITILVFILDYFQEKLVTKFFKTLKKTYFRGHFGPFCPNLSKNEISWKKELCQFFNYYNYLSLRQKSENTNQLSLRKMPNRRTDRPTVTLQDPSQDRGPIIKVTLGFPEFISTDQKSVYSIHFFVRYNQFKNPVTRVGTPTYDHDFNELVSTCKKSAFFIILFQRYS